MTALWSLAAGAVVGLGLWLFDLSRLSSHSFAGVTDHDAADLVLSVTGAAVTGLEIRLMLVHVLIGATLGGIAFLFRRSVSVGGSLERDVSFAALFTFAVALTALLGMVGTYPQLVADKWWMGGGVLAALLRFVTHTVGPTLFDIVTMVLLGGALGTPLVKAVRSLSTQRKLNLWKAAAVTGVALGLALVLALGARLKAKPAPFDRPVNVLILASDSLRTDRLLDSSVMPFTQSRIASGALYRYAVTPISRTYPAWVSTLTGTEPRAHDVRHMFPTSRSRRDVGETLFTELRDQGYFTFAASDFAGDVFPGFEGGFEVEDTPHLNIDTLAMSTVLSHHTWSLPLLRFAWFRGLFPYWRNVPSIADPEWVVDRALGLVDGASGRPFAGLVFFSTAHFPYVGPYPFYKERSGDYRGDYLYQVPPVEGETAPDEEDVRQIAARYDGALMAIDRAMERLMASLEARGLTENTLIVITGDHGEELYEEPGIAGHGDTIRNLRSQAVPILFLGPGVSGGVDSSAQVRHYDLPATVLDLLDDATRFGHGVSLLDNDATRPICVETGIWFWPSRPKGLQGRRLDYPGISALLDLDTKTREMVLKTEIESLVESAKERGLILANRLYREQLTPNGFEREIIELPGLDGPEEDTDLEALFQARCVDGDPLLSRLYGAVVFERGEP